MRRLRHLVLPAILLVVFIPLTIAQGLLPEIPAAKARFSAAQGCVEPVGDMRKNHMEYILHQRDATVHEGIRDRQHSLVECINCHVGAAPNAPRSSSEQHFCTACHSYAAVKIDCFQCHADRAPERTGKRHSQPTFTTGQAPAQLRQAQLHGKQP